MMHPPRPPNSGGMLGVGGFRRKGKSMFGLLKSVVELAADVAEVVTKPVEMVVDLADAAIKPVAEAAKDLADDIKSLKD